MPTSMNWSKRCAYDDVQKDRFHRTAKCRLKAVTDLLGWSPGNYDLRTNKAGPAVSGEITLHHDRVYVQVSQSMRNAEILIRSCQGRRDYTGGTNTFAAIGMLDDLPALALKVQKQMRADEPPKACAPELV